MSELALDRVPVTRRSGALARARGFPLATAGAVVLGMAVSLAVAAPLLPIQPPDAIEPSQRLLPLFSPGHFLGTDDLGRDVLSRLIWGARVSLIAGLLATLGSLVPGVVIGILAGYSRPSVDTILMRMIDILLAFPPLLLAIAIVAVLGPGLTNAMIAVAVVGIPTYARLARSVVLEIRSTEYIEAARTIGASQSRIVFRHTLPNLVAPIIVVASLDVGVKIIVTASLSFLGLGVQPPDADWGSMLARGRGFMATAPQIVAVPGLAIMLVVLSLNVIGDALREILDPRFHSQSGT